MKFDYAIRNPPYNDEQGTGNQKNFAAPVYNKFLDAAYEISDKVELIHPARFLFDAGATPKEWNQKMLRDPHLKVLFHEQDSSKVFANTSIKGGVAITYRDATRNFGAIETYTAYPELNTILKKVSSRNDFNSFGEIIANRGLYRFSKKAYAECPQEMEKITDSRVGASSFERMPTLFTVDKPNDGKSYAQFFGLLKGKREYRWFRIDYFNKVESFEHYKVLLPAANGSGALGETLSTPIIGHPFIGHTETFLSIGNFIVESDAKACMNYIKSKFCRALLGVLKITQHNSADKWKYVPLQDFTSNSEINWSASIHDIDQQLYKKYGLSQQEIDFIESHVKEMA